MQAWKGSKRNSLSLPECGDCLTQQISRDATQKEEECPELTLTPEGAFLAGPHCVPPALAPMQVAEHVQEQLHKVDSTMSKPTAESLFDLYRKLQELYQMKDSLPNRYPALRGEMPKGGIEQLTEDPCILPTHLHH